MHRCLCQDLHMLARVTHTVALGDAHTVASTCRWLPAVKFGLQAPATPYHRGLPVPKLKQAWGLHSKANGGFAVRAHLNRSLLELIQEAQLDREKI